jgi:hypothetical protein
MGSERAVIVWDGKRRLQHFIRSAEFVTDAKDVGFLVPTPTVPQLAAASPTVFESLRSVVNERMAKEPGLAVFSGGKGRHRALEVVYQQSVGGYNATVLKATDAGAAEGWLRENGYPVSKSTKDWLTPYVTKGWTITAFKLIDEVGIGMRLSPVRMTFATDAPIYPYREPRQGGNEKRGRLLELYLVGDSTFNGSFAGGPWVGRKTWSGELNSAERAKVRSALRDIPVKATHLTLFHDTSDPRNGTDDVVFEAEPAPPASSPTPYVLPVVGIGLVGAAWRFRRAASRRKAQPSD